MSVSVWLRLGRVSNLPTVWTNVLAGAALAGAALSPAAVLPGMLALSLFYVGGMFLNDAFDRNFDLQHKPDRPIPAGEVSAKAVFGAGFGLLGVGTLGVWLWARSLPLQQGSPPLAVLSALGLGAAIVFYDAYHKQNPLSPLVMGVCRVLVYTTCALALRAQPSWMLLWGALGLLGHLIGLTYVAKQEDLNRLGALWPLFLLALPLGIALYWGSGWLVWGIAGLHTAWLLHCLWFLRRETRAVPQAVVRMIAAISLVDALWLAVMGQPQWAAAALIAVQLTRLGQRYVPGT